MRVDILSSHHCVNLLNVFSFIVFGKVEEEDALADAVMASAKLLIVIEAEAKATLLLHLGLRETFYLVSFDGDHGWFIPSRGSWKH